MTILDLVAIAFQQVQRLQSPRADMARHYHSMQHSPPGQRGVDFLHPGHGLFLPLNWVGHVTSIRTTVRSQAWLISPLVPWQKGRVSASKRCAFISVGGCSRFLRALVGSGVTTCAMW